MEESSASLEEAIVKITPYLRARLSNVFLQRSDLDDAKQEIYLSFVRYWQNEEKPDIRAIYRITNQTLYRLIRDEKNDHLEEASRVSRHAINHPIPLTDVLEVTDGSDFVRVLMLRDFLFKATVLMTKTELPIYLLMCEGFEKPSAIAGELYGDTADRKASKAVSFHMGRIREKLKLFWRAQG